MSARELSLVRSRSGLLRAAKGKDRVRVRGVVVETGGGYSGRYRNAWLRVEAAGASVRVTAALSSRLGLLPVGSSVELAVWLTGMVDLAGDVFMAERAQLLACVPRSLPRPGV